MKKLFIYAAGLQSTGVHLTVWDNNCAAWIGGLKHSVMKL